MEHKEEHERGDKNNMLSQSLSLNAEKLFIRILFLIVASIVFANILNELCGKPYGQITRVINMDMEANFPTWFSSMLLATAAFFSFNCSRIIKSKQGSQKLWVLLFLGLLAMSCDETAVIHENIGMIINNYFFNLNLRSHWIVFIGPFILLVIFLFARKMKPYLTESKQARRFFFSGVLTYILGAFVLEFLLNFISRDNVRLAIIESTLEETCEMVGAILIIQGLLKHSRFLNGERPDPVLSASPQPPRRRSGHQSEDVESAGPVGGSKKGTDSALDGVGGD
jgi:hypothetical protein